MGTSADRRWQTQHASQCTHVGYLFSENFLLRVLLAQSRGYSSAWFRRLHLKRYDQFEMLTSLQVVTYPRIQQLERPTTQVIKYKNLRIIFIH